MVAMRGKLANESHRREGEVMKTMMVKKPINRRLLLNQVMSDMALDLEQLHGRSRAPVLSFARAVCATVLLDKTALSKREVSHMVRGNFNSSDSITLASNKLRAGEWDDQVEAMVGKKMNCMEYAAFCAGRAEKASQ